MPHIFGALFRRNLSLSSVFAFGSSPETQPLTTPRMNAEPRSNPSGAPGPRPLLTWVLVAVALLTVGLALWDRARVARLRAVAAQGAQPAAAAPVTDEPAALSDEALKRPIVRPTNRLAVAMTRPAGPSALTAEPAPAPLELPVETPPHSRQGGGDLAGGLGTLSANTVRGRVTFKGAPPPERALPLDPMCQKLQPRGAKTRFYVVNPAGGLADVVVYISAGVTNQDFPPNLKPVVLDQAGCEYIPQILAIRTGQPLVVRNSDPMMHNVHVMPTESGNKESNRAQMPKAPDLSYTFDTPELFVKFKCDVHPWMFAWVAVIEHPYFAVTDSNGEFELNGLPPGKYIVTANHRKTGVLKKEITVTNSLDRVDFQFQVP